MNLGGVNQIPASSIDRLYCCFLRAFRPQWQKHVGKTAEETSVYQ